MSIPERSIQEETIYERAGRGGAMPLATPAPTPNRLARAWRAFVGSEQSAVLAKRSTFDGAEISRLLMDWLGSVLRPDQEVRWNARILRRRAQDLRRNNATARKYGFLLVENVIGADGPQLQAEVRVPGSEDLDFPTNRALERSWKAWAEAPVTVDGRLDFVELQQLAIQTVATDGECFVRYWRNFAGNEYGLGLQLIDAELLDEQFNREASATQNAIVLGIEVDALGAPVAYHFSAIKPSDSLTMMPSERYRVPADEIRHLYRPERVNQSRGITWSAPIMYLLKLLKGYMESEMVAARIAASKMGFFQTREGAAVGEMSADPKKKPATISANPGTFEVLEQGYEFKEWSPDHPVAAFGPFVKENKREIASGLGVSYNGMANDLEGVNFSSLRSGLLREHDHWRVLQRWWCRKLCTPTYREFVNMALLRGKLALGNADAGRYYEVQWNPRGWPWVDPLKDVQASALAISHGLDSRTDILAAQGKDVRRVFEKLGTEAKMAQQYGVELAEPAATGGVQKPDPNAPDAPET